MEKPSAHFCCIDTHAQTNSTATRARLSAIANNEHDINKRGGGREGQVHDTGLLLLPVLALALLLEQLAVDES